jgi:hypothetical protein
MVDQTRIAGERRDGMEGVPVMRPKLPVGFRVLGSRIRAR